MIAGEFLQVQIEAGAAAVQLFDSWAGALSRGRLRRSSCCRTAARVLEPLAGTGVPRIHFGVGTGELLARDARGRRRRRRRRLAGAAGRGGAPARARAPWCRATSTRRCCCADWPVVEREVRRVVAEGRAADGHIFNLGHGVLPDTDPDVLTRVVELVHSL